MSKRMISLRLEKELLVLLERVAKMENSMFWKRDRTWLIEYAIRKAYQPLLEETGGAEKELFGGPTE